MVVIGALTLFNSRIWYPFFCLFLATLAHAGEPKLNFSDLVNGPATGLGDGQGSGAIVTVWGQHLGDSKGSSKFLFEDSSGTVRPVAHIYYWKRADGSLPGGPANLYDSHRMQEVAISIPASSTGEGFLFAEVAGVRSNKLPFKVRAGKIRHVTASGSNDADGSFNRPWRTVNLKSNGALAKNSAGDLIYSHGVVDAETTNKTAFYGIGMYSNRSPGTLNNQTAIVSYPGTQARIESYHFGFDVDKTRAFVLSKYKVLTGNHVEPAASSNSPLGIQSTISVGIQGSADGRIIGNFVGDLPGRCPSSQAGAIVANHNGGYDYVSNLKVLGNHIDNYGCKQTSRYHHTTYFSIRWAATARPFELGWNYLKDNMADGGLHAYDENGPGQGGCGNWSGPVRIHDNVVINQRGAGVVLGTNGSKPCWTNDFLIYNNILKNTGTGPNLLEPNVNIGASAIWFWGGAYTGTVKIYNNLISEFGDAQLTHDPNAAIGLSGWGDGQTILFENNIVEKAKPGSAWVETTSSRYGQALLDDIRGSNNLFYNRPGAGVEAIPSWSERSILADPQLDLNDGAYFLRSGSPAVDGGLDKALTHDIYGNKRRGSGIGPFELWTPSAEPVPPLPPGLRIE